jgi:hypothetical protein
MTSPRIFYFLIRKQVSKRKKKIDMNFLPLQLAELDADTREMLQMLHDTCVQETGVDEGT